MKRLLLSVSVAALGTACANVAQMPPANFSEPLPDVAAQYRTVRVCEQDESHHHTAEQAQENTGESIDWRFFRSAQRLTIENLSAQTGEDWQRDGKAIFMRKLFYAEKKAVEYRSDDLRVLNMDPQWQHKALLVDPEELQQLGAPKGHWQDNVPLYRYQGEVAGESLLVEWRSDLDIPVRIERRVGRCEETTALQQASALADSPWQLPVIADYLVIDYSDIGDMERDPFIQRVVSRLPGGDVHHH